ncbi:hypothetical protein CKCBHOJB_01618 [Thauera sp. GDN1]|uniref:hypothetical protein n=1 Tax=Thauera sp. GDN1 TaxID=2944810 RepID=UPI00247A5D9C|nr:hypothetical protein [Thauera sp. GDN1]WEN42033.1 hypothetical protein CKCBHOJB_01618 [Thauera sp. GDN1]
MSPDAIAWSAPDARGISTAVLGKANASSLRGRRLLRALRVQPADTEVWPTVWRRLAAQWLKSAPGADTRLQWDSLLRKAGAEGANTALALYEDLLAHGQIEAEEVRDRGGWMLKRLRFTDPAALRRHLGLPEPDADLRAWQLRRDTLDYADADLAAAARDLDSCAPKTALARADLLDALARWRDAGPDAAAPRAGTRRDFSLFARGDTKAITDADWTWLEERFDLAADGIVAHAPIMLLRATFTARTHNGSLDLGALPAFIGLPPAAVSAMVKIEPAPRCWRLVENRTVFDRLATKLPADEALVWLPGYPPGWWSKAMCHLLRLGPAPAFIACDPDPDGIAIAMLAGSAWQALGLPWAPDRMDADALERLPARRDLSMRDLALLDRLERETLPPALIALAAAMRSSGQKGEQEGLF